MMLLGVARAERLDRHWPVEPPRIERRDGTLVLSALTRHVDLENSAEVHAACPMLATGPRA